MPGAANILRGNILIVDDQAANVLLIEQMLGGAGVHGEDVDALTGRADLALYQAKRAGKNPYRISENIKDGR